MWRNIAKLTGLLGPLSLLSLSAGLMAGCAQLSPPTARDVQAKKFESVADKAVIYIARPRVDSPTDGPIVISNTDVITTYQGTYYRWEAAPGTHRIQGYGPFNASITLRTEAGKIYYVQHSVVGSTREGTKSMYLQQVDEQRGRKLVSDAQSL